VCITVRRATKKDAALIATLVADVQALHAAALPGRFKPASKVLYVKDAAAALKRPQSFLFIAYVANDAAGFVHAEILRAPGTSLMYAQELLYVQAISVLPNYRRRGVGTALMAAVRDAGHSLKIDRLELNVWTFNEAARQFFRRHGFTPYCETYVTASDLGRDRCGG